jgi:hypothetical protein
MVMNSTQVSELELEDFQGKVTQNTIATESVVPLKIYPAAV